MAMMKETCQKMGIEWSGIYKDMRKFVTTLTKEERIDLDAQRRESNLYRELLRGQGVRCVRCKHLIAQATGGEIQYSCTVEELRIRFDLRTATWSCNALPDCGGMIREG